MFSEQFFQQEEGINIPESEKAMIQHQIISLNSVMCTSESNIEELEQYGQILCLCIERVPIVENEASEDIFNSVLDICKNGNISENDIDCAHRIGTPYVDNISKK